MPRKQHPRVSVVIEPRLWSAVRMAANYARPAGITHVLDEALRAHPTVAKMLRHIDEFEELESGGCSTGVDSDTGAASAASTARDDIDDFADVMATGGETA